MVGYENQHPGSAWRICRGGVKEEWLVRGRNRYASAESSTSTTQVGYQFDENNKWYRSIDFDSYSYYLIF